MKTRTLALTLFTATAAAVALFPLARGLGAASPPQATARPSPFHAPAAPVGHSHRIDVVFVLDTTGSMGGLIHAAKEKIWSIASTLAAAEQTPAIRMGLVAYRDRGDAYVTQVTDLSADLDATYATLMDLEAAGGGDEPESVNQALYDAVHTMSWSQDPNAYRVVFLVGDAPPHMDYQDDVKYTETLRVAHARGIVVNAIRCGGNARTRGAWQRIAALGNGRFFDVDRAGSAVAIATPFDEKLAALARDLDGTRLAYGSAEEKARYREKLAASARVHAESSVAAQARRATFNASAAGATNLIGEGELVEDVTRGRVAIEALPPAALPEPLRALAPAERAAAVQQKAARRDALKREIDALARQRAAYLHEQVRAMGGARESLDRQLFDAVKEQAGKSGIVYGGDAPAY